MEDQKTPGLRGHPPSLLLELRIVLHIDRP
jgi:hypothetical protein